MRKIAILGLLLLGVVTAGWSAIWFYVAHEAAGRFDAWLASEDAQGRSWTCPGRRVGGYPLALTIACTKPTYAGRTPDGTETGTAASLTVDAAITHPTTLVLGLGAPLTYKSADGAASIVANWSSLSIDLAGVPDVRSVVLHGRDVAVENVADGGGQRGRAPTLEAAFDLSPPAAGDTVGFDIAAGGVALPQLDALLGGETPVDLRLAGRLDKREVTGAATLPQAIERWREQGGQVSLVDSRVGRGDQRVTGTGTLGLDEAHRLQGRLQASFVGLEPVLKRFGISTNVAAAGALLGALFGGGPPKTPPEPGAIALPISFQGGRVGVGPIRTQIALPPLY